MTGDLFSKPPLYTIDTSSLIDIFGTEKMVSKQYMPGLWDKLLGLIGDGRLISHVEVLNEIRKDGTKGEELYEWAQANKTIFTDHDWEREGAIIRTMSPKYAAFVNAKPGPVHADPWLVAQARCRKLTIISEEKFRNTSVVANYKLPNVCADPLFNVPCVDLLGLVKEQGEVLSRGV